MTTWVATPVSFQRLWNKLKAEDCRLAREQLVKLARHGELNSHNHSGCRASNGTQGDREHHTANRLNLKPHPGSK